MLVTDLAHFDKDMRTLFIEIDKEIFVKIQKQLLRAADLFVKELRSQLRAAPYSAKGRKAGPWSRHKGVPAEESIFLGANRTEIYAYVKNSGSPRKGIPPSEYLHIGEVTTQGHNIRGALKYVNEARDRLLENIDKALR